MDNSKLNEALFTTPELEFGNHLSTPNNHRILFSGRFGIGKTTFIKWFFDREEQKEKYNVIHLYPINYSVASNEDIFRYLKMDILIHLLENSDLVIENIQLDDLTALQYFLIEKPFEIITTAISLFMATQGDQKITTTLIDKIEKLKAKFSKFKDEKNEELSDLKTKPHFSVIQCFCCSF